MTKLTDALCEYLNAARKEHTKNILESSMINNFKYYCSNFFASILDGISKFRIILDSVKYKTYPE